MHYLNSLASSQIDLDTIRKNEKEEPKVTDSSFFKRVSQKTMERPEKIKLMYGCPNGTTKQKAERACKNQVKLNLSKINRTLTTLKEEPK
jgi:hypothetical protein